MAYYKGDVYAMVNGIGDDPRKSAEVAESERKQDQAVRALLKPFTKCFHPDLANLPRLPDELEEKSKDLVPIFSVISRLISQREEKLRFKRWPSEFDLQPGVSRILYYGRDRSGEVRGPAVGVLPNTPNAFCSVVQEFLKSGEIREIHEVAEREGVHELEGPIWEAETFDDIARLRNLVLKSGENQRVQDRLFNSLTESHAVIVKKMANNMLDLEALQALRNDTYAFLRGRGQGLMFTDSIYIIEQRAKKVAEEMIDKAGNIAELEDVLKRVNEYTFSAPTVYKEPLFEIGFKRIEDAIARAMKRARSEKGYDALKEQISQIQFAQNADEQRQRLLRMIEKHQRRYPDPKKKVLKPKDA